MSGGGTCERCGKSLKDIRRHVAAVHHEAAWMHPIEPRPHPSAYKVTIEDHGYLEGSEVTYFEWHTERYGTRRHGWFIPVEVPDNFEPAPVQEQRGEQEP